MSRIRMYMTTWCPDCRFAEMLLDQEGIGYETINIDQDPEAAQLVIERNRGRRKVPTFEVDGNWFAVSPFNPDYLLQQLESTLPAS